ncbi:AAA family ATPase [Aquimarina mytili]|uniref:Novel STAND NTPase 1 domain-containing protein n=1 Tax=Aquimarina mytili TaxID=874423 RepID=A0A937D8R2_9FLAO|nr:AAA family ATPase [Aquimarina mytili]MBL0682977.1 hypothetical protein [Aquimarina mytili]
MPHSKIISPFKFLNSYQKKDYLTYFGRDQESIALFDLYKDSTIMILHGPSGSGKTSLIYCGLLNRIRYDKQVISIRRDENLIESIKKKLFIYAGNDNWTPETPSKLLDDFFSFHEDLNRILGFIDHIEELMLTVEEEILERKRNKRKIRQTSTEQSIAEDAPDTEEKDDQYVISQYKERLQKFILERKELLEKLGEKNVQLSTISNQLNEYFTNIRVSNSGASFTPLIIFDQFEELFVHGTKDEMNKLGLFLKLIFDYKIPFNIIISLREEYFGYLDQLQSYIPHIFYKKIRLAHPNKESIQSIIEKSFLKFNINQYKGDTDEKLSDIEKYNRIELILDQIKIKDNGSTSYHLPFLQVYLDRLYKVDYYRTYGDQQLKDENNILLPLEFKEHEIKEFGSIEHVLENYIREINNKIIRNTNNKLNNKTQHKDSIIKFLRHFKTKDDLKKRVPIQIEKENYYIIDNQKILNKIQTDIWEDNDPEYNDTVSEIINELKEKGILNVSTGYAELSHDIIAKVISNIRTEDDFRSLIKKDFISSFDIYEDTKNTGDLLSAQQIERMNQCMSYIMNDDDADRLKRKKQFLSDSIRESQKEELEKKKLEKRLKIFFYYPFILTSLLFILAALAYSLQKSVKENRIKELLSYALRDYNVDKTSSFNYIRASEKIREEKLLWFLPFDTKFDLLMDFKNDLYREYKRMPFYYNSIDLRKDQRLTNNDTITSTKTRRFPANSDTLYLFAATSSEKLIISPINYVQKNSKANSNNIKNNIVAFEPYISHKNNVKELMILIAQRKPNNSLVLRILDTKGNVIDKNDNVIINGTKIDIEHKANEVFIIGVDNKILELDFSKSENKINEIENLDQKIRKIKALNNTDFIVLYGKDKLYLNKKNEKTINILEDIEFKEDDIIHTFKVKNKDTVLLGLRGRIKELDLNTLNANDHYVHDEQINTIALDKEKNEMLIGSRDNGANLWNSDKMLRKQFIGHSKPIHNVSFIKGDTDFIITSGEDQMVKIWNITPIEDRIINSDSLYKHLKNVEKVPLSRNTKITYLQKKINQGNQDMYDYINNIRDIDFSKNSRYAISGNSDNTAILWKKTKAKFDTLQVLSAHTSEIVDLEFHENDYILTASSDHTVQIYKKDNPRNSIARILNEEKNEFTPIPSLIRHDYPIKTATFYKNGKYIISTDIKGNTKKWNFLKFDSIINARTYSFSPDVLKK